jgi:hypothetical protein
LVKISPERLHYLEQLEREKELETLKNELPHRWAHKLYPWQDEFLKEKTQQCWVVSGNQVGKSSIQIIKCIELAINKKLWPDYFGRTPSTFWYFYPKKGLATIEFEEKWKKCYLPRGKMKRHPVFGWESHKKDKEIHTIVFNSGVTIYFMSYEMKPENIQAI